MSFDSLFIKNLAFDLGADACGVASASAFSGAPEGHRPGDLETAYS